MALEVRLNEAESELARTKRESERMVQENERLVAVLQRRNDTIAKLKLELKQSTASGLGAGGEAHALAGADAVHSEDDAEDVAPSGAEPNAPASLPPTAELGRALPASPTSGEPVTISNVEVEFRGESPMAHRYALHGRARRTQPRAPTAAARAGSRCAAETWRRSARLRKAWARSCNP